MRRLGTVLLSAVVAGLLAGPAPGEAQAPIVIKFSHVVAKEAPKPNIGSATAAAPRRRRSTIFEGDRVNTLMKGGLGSNDLDDKRQASPLTTFPVPGRET